MIARGCHREAMWWIWICHAFSFMAIQNDAPAEERPRFRESFHRLLGDLGLNTSEDWSALVEQIGGLAKQAFQLADEIVASNPEIVD